jgi:hypothetical protein
MSQRETEQIMLERSSSDIAYALKLYEAGSVKTAKEILRDVKDVLDVLAKSKEKKGE